MSVIPEKYKQKIENNFMRGIRASVNTSFPNYQQWLIWKLKMSYIFIAVLEEKSPKIYMHIS